MNKPPYTAQALTRPPNFLIVGFPRCGTTYLWSLLRQHPDIFLPDEKEPHFFCHEDWAHRLEEYDALFADAPSGSRVGEATTSYILWPGLLQRILSQLNEDSRFIVALRNPVERYESDYFNACAMEGERRPPTQVIDEELRSTGSSSPDSRQAKYLYRNTTAPKIRHWLDQVGSDRLHSYLNESLRGNERACLQAIFEFIGVDPDAWNPPAPELTKPKSRSGQLPASIGHLTTTPSLQPIRAAYRKLLPRSFRESVRSSLSKQKARFSDEDRAKLREYFADDIAETGALIGRDLSHWSKNES